MSLSTAFGNALSGLNVASRGTQVVSSNIANAQTDGYGRRVLETSSAGTHGSGSGVRIEGVQRQSDVQLLTDRRMAEAETSQLQTRADALSSIEAAMGTPDEEYSIAGRIAALESALVNAASRPDSETRLADVLNAAYAVTDSINDATDTIQELRTEAEKAIAQDVDTLNNTLERVVDLNNQIKRYVNSGYDYNGLLDQRQVLIDQISEIVPVRQIARPNEEVALYTENGAILLDGRAAEIGFESTSYIDASMSVEDGQLNGLTLNGNPISVAGSRALMGGGRLEGLFDQRDTITTEAQTNLDALARNLIERFEGVDVDGTGAGLFTDSGSALNIVLPEDEVGLSDRIEINSNGDTLWRLRSGLGAATPGEVGDATLLNAYADALSSSGVPASGDFTIRSYSAAELATETVNAVSVKALQVEQEASLSSARTTALMETEAANGVDTDAELQDLLRYEEAYIANARVIQTLETMMNALLEL
ncbi:Flagellar hook-associated protein FlgK [Rhodovulum sp. P5]|uniref:flagellar hook-associated protein FlgK n=1 Tax=Rhodovulum sp. P5 TaxID=1564506 RepID=UPI0009C365CD|nr:flagellar hook-associated protein FlgK [Rhodovulum sp. P5]ARE40423.1 Flagellar hook-associated protein FlgK [Rhodovulum sp. P5]